MYSYLSGVKKHLLLLNIFILHFIAHAQLTPDYRNTQLPLNLRVNALLQTLSTDEKILFLGYRFPGIERLNIPAYTWWNEALHGVARAGTATVFPQAIGMAASFHPALVQQAAGIISTEARAKYNLMQDKEAGQQYAGLTFWSPNINLYRDPRWGRGQETYGEDPFLTAEMGVAFVKGLQGTHGSKLKVAACAKHFAVHSGPEKGRHAFNALVTEKDLQESYLYAFGKLSNAGVEAVMCAYNRVNDKPCCTSPYLLQEILRKQFAFNGHILTDCWALEDIRSGHKLETDAAVISADAIKAGVSLDCSDMFQKEVKAALERGLLSPAELDSAVAKNLRTLFKLSWFDPKEESLYTNYKEDSIANSWHHAVAYELALESMVLLHNKNNALPLHTNTIKGLLIAGPQAANEEVLMGNYYGVSKHSETFLSGLAAALGGGIRLEYDKGCTNHDTTHFGGIWAAGFADAVILCLGQTAVYEGEEGDAFLSATGGDRGSMQLPPGHLAYLRAMRKAYPMKKIIAVVSGGGSTDLAEVKQLADAILFCWYPGEAGGSALASLLLGKASPSGKLPVSFYSNAALLPPFESYAFTNRTYRFTQKNIAWPFGFGLSYTQFKYAWAGEPVSNKNTISFSVTVKNTGSYAAWETIQLYVEPPAANGSPLRMLKGIDKIWLNPGEEKTVTLQIQKKELQSWSEKTHQWQNPLGEYRFHFAAHAQQDLLTARIKFTE